MVNMNEVYKCDLCGNIVQINHASKGTLVCCDQPMVLQKEGTTDAAKEKHVPEIEKRDNGFYVKVGSVDHPMEDKHYIEWIEILADNKTYKQFLKPGDKPEAFFEISASSVTAREYCNLHGHWKSDL
jgi:superoxide reductase